MTAILILLALSMNFADAADEGRTCELNGGECVSESAVDECGERLSHICDSSFICCKSNTRNLLVEKNCQCGQAREIRIIGGEEVSPKNKYPWMLGIHDVTIDKPYICGATLINDRYAVSAAHCFFDLDGNEIPKASIKLGLADHNESSANDDVPNVTRLVDIEYYFVHENYIPNPIPSNDIALIKLKDPLDLAEYKEIQPVCLPVNKDATYEGMNGTVVGWGRSGIKPDPHVLQEVTVPILNPNCSGLVPGYIEAMLCAGMLKGGKDSCQGDSGGPLIVKEGDTYVLVGIVSFGIGCAQPLNPGVYTRVSHFLDWIKDHTSDAYYCS